MNTCARGVAARRGEERSLTLNWRGRSSERGKKGNEEAH